MNRTISTEYSINELNVEELNVLKSYTSLYGPPIIRWDNRLFLNVPFVDPKLSYSKEPIFDISVELSQAELESNLNKLLSHEGSNAFIIDRLAEWSIGGNRSLISFGKSFIGQVDAENMLEGQKTVRVDGRDFLMVYKTSDLLGFVLFVLIPKKAVSAPLDSYSRLSWILSGLSGFIILIFTVWIYSLVMQPLDKLISAFGQVEEGNLEVAVYRKSRDEFGYLYHQFNEMVKNLKSLFQQTYEQKTRLKNAELKQLQYQINPHFLYNSIFLIYRMAKVEDYKNIIRLSQHLGNYYQFITRNAKDEIPLSDEINHAKDYTEIQNIRFGDRIKVIWEQDDGDYENILVPRLILQPLIENAYYHGLRNKASGGIILIRLSANPSQISISIQDNGSELKDEEIAALQQSLMDVSGEIEVTAILNIHRRLQIRYGSNSGVTVSRGELGGLKVNLTACLKENRNVQIADC